MLKFSINNQLIKRVDTTTPVAGSSNYLVARFEFTTKEWAGLNKTAIFTGCGMTKHVILTDDACLVPWETIKEPGTLTVSLVAGSLITVNTASVEVVAAGYTEGTEPAEPTKDVYTQIIGRLDAVDGELAQADELVKSVQSYTETAQSAMQGAINNAIQSAQNAAQALNSEHRAQMYASGASKYESGAKDAEHNAQTAQAQAEQAKAEASESAKNAQDALTEAIITEGKVEMIAREVGAQVATAQDAAREATESAQTAQSAVASAQASAQIASQSATTATQKATESAQSAQQAETQAELARIANTDAQSAQQASETARDEAQTAKTDAQTAAQSAQASAQSVAGLAQQIQQNTATATDAKRLAEIALELQKGITYRLEDKLEEGMMDMPSGAINSTVMEAYGKTEQETTQGYNLFESKLNNATAGGTTVKREVDGSYTISGKQTSTLVFRLSEASRSSYESPLQFHGDYTMTVIADKSIAGLQVFATRGNDAGNSFVNCNSVNEPVYGNYTGEGFVALRVNTSFVGEPINIKIMLEEGTVAHNWEPYTGGIPSPNPDYPQEIQSVEKLDFKIVGKNLCKQAKNGQKSDGSTEADANNRWHLENENDDRYFDIKNNASVMLKVKENTRWNQLYIRFTDASKTVLTAYNITLADKNLNDGYIFTTPSDEAVKYMYIHAYHSSTINPPTNVMLCYSNAILPYEPYTPPITHTITPPRPLNAIGEYKDVLDVANGEWVWNCNSVDMGNIDWSKNSTPSSGVYRCTRTEIGCKPSKNKTDPTDVAICEGFIAKGYDPISASDNGNFAIGNSDNDRMIFVANEILSLDGFYDLVTGMKFLFALATPTTEPISAEDAEHLKTLELLSSGYTVTVTDQLGRDVSYLVKYMIDLREV